MSRRGCWQAMFPICQCCMTGGNVLRKETNCLVKYSTVQNTIKMAWNDNIEIVGRFFTAIRRLIDDNVIRGVQTFTRRYGINRRNFLTLEHEPYRHIFQVCWLAYLVNDYKVSPDWLITGNGSFYQPEWSSEKVKKMQIQCNSQKVSL